MIPIQTFFFIMFSAEHAPQLSITEVAILLRYAFSCVQPVTQRYKQGTVGEVHLQPIQSP